MSTQAPEASLATQTTEDGGGNGDRDSSRGGGQPNQSSFVKDVLPALIPAIVGVITFVGVLGFIGAALTWLRFEEAGLPASEAISVTPNARLVATGTGAVIYFIGAGLLLAAVIVVIPWSVLANWLTQPAPRAVPDPVQPPDFLPMPIERLWDMQEVQVRRFRAPAKVRGLLGWLRDCFRGLRDRVRLRFHDTERDELRCFGTSALVLVTGVLAAVAETGISGDQPLGEVLLQLLLAAVGLVAVTSGFALARTSPDEHHQRRFRLTKWDVLAVGTAVTTGAILEAWTGRWDLVYVMVAAGVVSLLVYGIADADRRRQVRQAGEDGPALTRFWPLAAALLFGVALYGAAWRAADYGRMPHVAPVAVLRESRDAKVHQILTGIYVAQTNKTMWIGGVTLNCTKRDASGDVVAVKKTGHIVSIPMSEIREYEVGEAGNFADALTALRHNRQVDEGLTPQLWNLHTLWSKGRPPAEVDLLGCAPTRPG